MVPRTVNRQTPQVPWDDAIEIAGSVGALIRGRHYKTWKGWEAKRFVPAHAMLDFLLRRWYQSNPGRGGRRRALARRLPHFPEEAIAMADAKARAIVLGVFRNLCEIQTLDPDLFEHLKGTIQYLAAGARGEARKQKRKAGRASG